MSKSFCRAAAVLFVLLGSIIAVPANAEELIGTWLTQDRDAQIRVAKCGKALCGTVAWLRDATDPKTGQPPVDGKNPDPGKRSRKIFGIQIFSMEQNATGSWTGGIYNSDDGKTYDGRLSPQGENGLEVQGCSGSLCGSETWTRVK